MKKIALALALTIIVSAIVVSLAGCGAKGSSKFIGTWELQSGSLLVFSKEITFKSGGKYVEVNDGFDVEGSYSVKSDTEVEINYLKYNYKFEGDTLTLYYAIGGGGQSATYKKK